MSRSEARKYAFIFLFAAQMNPQKFEDSFDAFIEMILTDDKYFSDESENEEDFARTGEASDKTGEISESISRESSDVSLASSTEELKSYDEGGSSEAYRSFEESDESREEKSADLQEKLNNIKSDEEYQFMRESIMRVLCLADRFDQIIASKLRSWSFERIGQIELTLLRLAVSEITREDFDLKDMPIVASSASKLAKQYCDEASVSFVQGIIAAVGRDIAAGSKTVADLDYAELLADCDDAEPYPGLRSFADISADYSEHFKLDKRPYMAELKTSVDPEDGSIQRRIVEFGDNSKSAGDFVHKESLSEEEKRRRIGESFASDEVLERFEQRFEQKSAEEAKLSAVRREKMEELLSTAKAFTVYKRNDKNGGDMQTYAKPAPDIDDSDKSEKRH